MANESIAIWRATDQVSGQLEATASAANKIILNPSPVLSTGGYVFNTELFYRNAVPENPKVGGQINEVQDMGLDGIDLQITGQFQPSTTNTDVAKLRDWMREDKMVQGGGTLSFEKGRFGLRMDDFPQFNIVPKGDADPLQGYGWVLAAVRFVRQGEFKNKLGVVITLRFSGDPVGLGT